MGYLRRCLGVMETLAGEWMESDWGTRMVI